MESSLMDESTMLEIANDCMPGIGWRTDRQDDTTYVFSAQDARPDVWDYSWCQKLATEVAARIAAADPENGGVGVVAAVEVSDGDWCLATSHMWVIDNLNLPFGVTTEDEEL